VKQVESIRIFKNPILEAMTHVHPIIPLLLWAPIVVYASFLSLTQDGLSVVAYLAWALIALIVWTLTEYVLHRYVFHWDPKHALGKRFVFLFHGLHHDDPNDPTRLVMPPVPALLIMFMLWKLFSLVIPSDALNAFMAWFIVGYLIYDYIHFATHHFKMTSKVGRYLKKWHIRHHFAHEKARYGVSSPLWDYVFKTTTGPKEDHA
tara:strand:- start:26870 stop:27484 length:615 start_codon:yes stop_codon:yes gene_type:complete